MVVGFLYFFFQAEDGIRDLTVTGVQTCALPIFPALAAIRVGDDPASAVYVRNKIRACEQVGIRSEQHALAATTTAAELRSEERRVGKECRPRGLTEPQNTKYIH